jgi:hypothetical protein
MIPAETTADAWNEADPTVCSVCGRDACEDHLPSRAAKRSCGLTIQRACDVISLPRPIAIVEGIAYADRLTVAVAESQVGKTFVALSIAASVSDGIAWHGRSICQGSVLYVDFDGDALGVRLRALRDRGHRLEHFYRVHGHNPLSPQLTRDREAPSVGEGELTEALIGLATELARVNRPPIMLVVIDTIRASMIGSEDLSDAVSAYLRAIRRIARCVPGAAFMLVHHAGWQDGVCQRRRERGSSAWRGNTDVTLYLEIDEEGVEADAAPLILSVLKDRDHEKAAPLRLIRRRVELAERDERGLPVTSCVIERDDRTREDRESQAAMGIRQEAQALDLRVLRAIAERPDVATSQEAIRLILGVRKAVVADSLARLVMSGWALPGPRKQPYTVTDVGRLALQGGR